MAVIPAPAQVLLGTDAVAHVWTCYGCGLQSGPVTIASVRLTYKEWARAEARPPGPGEAEPTYELVEAGLAFSGDDTPIETLRRIVGWVDA